MTDQISVAEKEPNYGKLNQEDFDIINDSLDLYVDSYRTSLSYIESAKAAAKIIQANDPNNPKTDAELSKEAQKLINQDKLKDDVRNVRDKIIVLKAKLIQIREKSFKGSIEGEIEKLLGGF